MNSKYTQTTRYQSWWLLLAPAAILIVYRRAMDFPFTNWDDIQFIAENPCLKAVNTANLRRIFTPGGIPGEMLYIPVTYLSFMLERMAFQLSPRAVHVNNIIFHCLNAALMFHLVHRWTNRKSMATVVACFFALHPLQVEAVAWAMGRKDVLSTFFALVTLAVYSRWLWERRIGWLAIWLVTATLAMAAKPSFLVLPALLLALDVAISPSASRRHWSWQLLTVAIAVILWRLNSMMPSQPPLISLPLPQRLQCIPWVLQGWASRFCLLSSPSPIYCWPDVGNGLPSVVPGCLLILIVSVLWWAAIRRGIRFVALGLTLTVIAFAPAIAIILETRDFITADRYGYFAIAGLFLAIAAAADIVPSHYRPLYWGSMTLWLFFWAGMTIHQIEVWRNSVNVWERARAACPRNPMIRNNLGMAYLDVGDTVRAAPEFTSALKANFAYLPAYNNLGRLYLDGGDARRAIEVFRAALTIDNGNSRAHKNLGDAFVALGRRAEAEREFQTAIEHHQEYAAAYIALGNLHQHGGDSVAAISWYESALRLDTTNPALLYNLGIAYEALQRDDQAIQSYQAAIRYRPAYVEATFNLGNLYSKRQMYAPAESMFLAVLRLRPNDVSALINLGNLYLRAGQLEQAQQRYRQALSFNPLDAAGIHYNLGLIHAQNQEWSQASAEFRGAIERKPDFGDAHYQLAKALEQLGNVSGALAECRLAATLGVNVDREFMQRLELRQQGQSGVGF